MCLINLIKTTVWQMQVCLTRVGANSACQVHSIHRLSLGLVLSPGHVDPLLCTFCMSLLFNTPDSVH